MSNHIIKNAAQCRKCDEIIESKYRHDFVMCKCGAIGVDGGRSYLRRIGHPESAIDLSVTEDYDDNYELENTETVITGVHAPSKCEGRSCPVHHKSDHSLRQMPQYISRSRTGQAFTVRECFHHIYHIDPDEDGGYMKGIGIDSSACLEGCDGCCRK